MSRPDRSTQPRDDESRIQDLLTVLEVTRSLGSSTDLMPLLEAIERSTRKVLDCDRASVFLYDPARAELFSQVATGVTGVRFPVTAGIAGEAFRTRGTVRVDDAYADSRFNSAIDKITAYTTRTILACPLLGWDNEPLGVLQALNKNGDRFQPWDEVLLTTLAAQAGVAVQRSRLLEQLAEKKRIERDLQVARMIQRRLLPERAPTPEGFDLAGWNRPADSTGGDMYDFVTLSSGRIVIAIADAVGHGIGPALMATELRALLRAVVDQSDDPNRIVPMVNGLFCQEFADDKIATFFVGVLDPVQSRVCYVSAGQGPILVYRAAHDIVEQHPTHGLPLGVGPEFGYEPATEISFSVGDTLALLTDGFAEWADPDGQRFENERVRAVLRSGRGTSAVEMIATLVEEVTRFARGSPQQDDLTAVLVRRI